MSEYIHKSHNVNVLMYHFVCPAKYRRVVFSEEVEKTIKETCEEIEKRYEIRFLEIGADKDHIHFLVQSVPRYSPTTIITKIKSLTARKVFEKHPEKKDHHLKWWYEKAPIRGGIQATPKGVSRKHRNSACRP